MIFAVIKLIVEDAYSFQTTSGHWVEGQVWGDIQGPQTRNHSSIFVT